MSEIVKFFECMEYVIDEYPQVYFKIEKLRHNGWWRIHVFGKDMAIVGDAELLFVENRDREQAFMDATSRIKELITNIENLKENKHERINRKLQILRSELNDRSTRQRNC